MHFPHETSPFCVPNSFCIEEQCVKLFCNTYFSAGLRIKVCRATSEGSFYVSARNIFHLLDVTGTASSALIVSNSKCASSESGSSPRESVSDKSISFPGQRHSFIIQHFSVPPEGYIERLTHDYWKRLVIRENRRAPAQSEDVEFFMGLHYG